MDKNIIFYSIINNPRYDVSSNFWPHIHTRQNKQHHKSCQDHYLRQQYKPATFCTASSSHKPIDQENFRLLGVFWPSMLHAALPACRTGEDRSGTAKSQPNLEQTIRRRREKRRRKKNQFLRNYLLDPLTSQK